MKAIVAATCILILMVGCRSTASSGIPSEAKLVAASSADGKYNVTIERYDPVERIAVVQTPGWLPERKPYQFDGKEWIPLWSPVEPPEMK